DIDLSSLLAAGDGFALFDVQNYFGDPVLTGTYDGPVAIPMTPGTTSEVIGTPTTPYVHTSAEFGAFVLLRTEAGPGGTGDGTGGDTGSADETGGDSATAEGTDGADAADDVDGGSLTTAPMDGGGSTGDGGL